MVAAAWLGLSGTAWVGCTPSAPSPPSKAPESAGQFLDSSVITTRVKAAILNEPSLKSSQISVETYKDVVQLSGFVDGAESKQRAGKAAAAVEGVSSVRNDLVVK
ncbi:MAG: BON domain-containing protein [Deltaproteobacteria bacterium]|nr:BON domain-containing protein [Deltaproteobacteria bacterium]